jgi:hypothetical protein
MGEPSLPVWEEKRSNIMGLEDPGIMCIYMPSQCKEKELCRVGSVKKPLERRLPRKKMTFIK